VAQKSHFYYRWDKSHVFTIGGTNVSTYYRWHKWHILTIGGTYVAVGEISWWDKCQVGLMSVGQMSVGQMSVGQKSRHHNNNKKVSNCITLIAHQATGP
jgi:hypothetical protein